MHGETNSLKRGIQGTREKGRTWGSLSGIKEFHFVIALDVGIYCEVF